MSNRADSPSRETSLRRIAPNLLTYGNLTSGLVALGVLVGGGPNWIAMLLVCLALVCDLLDGRVARALGSANPFGVQLDSLADLVTFGVVPAAVVYTWLLYSLGALGIAAACFLVAAAATRLARFNVEATSDGPVSRPGTFTGLPVTIPAALLCSAAAMDLRVGGAVGLCLGVLFLAGLMISRIPFRSLKRVPAHLVVMPPVALALITLVGTGSVVASLAATLFAVSVLFVVSGPLDALRRDHA